MTKEEAINLIDINRNNLKATNEEGFSKDIEALDMAIKALEQKVCEYWCVDGYCRRSEVPKIGHWGRKTKVDAYDIAGVKTWGIKCQCDRCGFTTIVVEDFGYYKYCPNCGAKMEGEE